MLRHERRTAPESEYAKLADATLQFARLLAGTAYTEIEIPSERVTYIDPPPATIDNGPCEARRQVVRAMHDKARQDRADFRDMLRAEPQPTPPLPGQFAVTDLTAEVCHFPLGDGPFLFCGEPTIIAPYCGRCARIAYR
jgi:hypothetical protein